MPPQLKVLCQDTLGVRSAHARDMYNAIQIWLWSHDFGMLGEVLSSPINYLGGKGRSRYMILRPLPSITTHIDLPPSCLPSLEYSRSNKKRDMIHKHSNLTADHRLCTPFWHSSLASSRYINTNCITESLVMGGSGRSKRKQV